MEKCFEDVRQDEKHVPDLLEAIIQPPGLVKEELRPISFIIDKFNPKSQKSGLTQKLKVPKWVCRSPLAFFEAAKPFCAIFGPARGQIYGKNAEKI